MTRTPIPRRALLGAAPTLALAPAARAETWPSRPIRLVVPYPPGGGSDTMARIIYPRVAERLGQPIVIDNRGGATGTIGEAAVAQAPADGYTVLHDAAAIGVNPALFRSLPFDFDRDFAPVTLVVTFPNLLLVHPDVPVRTVADVIAMAKAKPGGVDWASSGNGSNQHLSMVLFARAAGITVNHIPYRGGGPAIADVIAGNVPFVFGAASGQTGHVLAGRVRAVGHTGAGRLAALPDVPPIADTLPGFEALDWQGVFVRSGTPRPIVERLSAAIGAVLREPAIRQRILSFAAEPRPMTPDEFAVFFAAERRKWTSLIREANITLE